MGTPFKVLFDSFLARIESQDWVIPEQIEIAERDWIQLLKIAVFQFRFPRVSLEFDENEKVFLNEVGNPEIQVLATIMKHQWIKRCIASWEQIKMLYSNKDFSQANHLDKLIKLSDQVYVQVIKALATYSRSINGKPFNYAVFAGKHQS